MRPLEVKTVKVHCALVTQVSKTSRRGGEIPWG